ncbi:glycosyltransferase [Dysgonomonas sp. ZJ279]|uniref:glycosyltransferase n=1 Tax=Dysgonomonas sp. ZJ279 TaxID=2709796 RepID=UPI0013EDA4BF|nr:glycosyltransferase [Dysgonomonas sp. ZJ279]
MGNKSKISIICVTKNAGKHLSSCIDSIISQKYSDIELVIFDALSTDTTIDILESYGNKISYWKSEQDAGIYDAMNKALKCITGQWVYFLGADDTLLPDFSAFAENELKDSTCIYYANVLYKGKKTKGEVNSYEQAKHGIFHQSIIYPASVFRKYSYNPFYKVSADYALNLMLHGDKSFKFVYRDYIIANYNDDGLSSYFVDEEFNKIHYSLVMKNFEWSVKFRFWFRNLKAKRRS